ncbi:LAGLIDADG family homing endonuclease [Aeropyrum pernix]|uniref:LAGLIDADG family homing endonuclease n=1 Tax=Aeropyrum pernix TaxID=56636 RepID=UPI0013F15A99
MAGIIDAEASLSVSIKIQEDLRCRVRVDPVFSITQDSKDVLNVVKNYFGCGRLMPKPGQEHLTLYVVDRLEALVDCLIPKLDRLPLIVKKRGFEMFREIVLTLTRMKYRRVECCVIRDLVLKSYSLSSLNKKSKRKRSLEEILKIIPCDKAVEPPGER